MRFLGQTDQKKLIKARNIERLEKIKSLKKELVKNDSIKKAIAHKLKSLSSNLPAMTVSPSHASYKVIGLVSATANSSSRISLDSIDSWGSRSGDESTSINEKAAQAESKVIHRLKVQASKQGANAVVGVALDFEQQSRNSISITATGTGVIFDKPKDIFIESQIDKLAFIEKARLDYYKVQSDINKIENKMTLIEREIEV